MGRIKWDAQSERTYETGVSHGVLYLRDSDGNYTNGVAWNGLTTVTESPSGAENNALYADNIKYLNLKSAEEFGATVEAYTYPPEFAECDGSAEAAPGVTFGQQPRKTFGMCFRTIVGNDTESDSYGYKLHLIYGCDASPSERSYQTVNDSPDAITFSWELTTTPVAVSGMKATSLITIDSTKVDKDKLAALEDILYGVDDVASGLSLYAEGDEDDVTPATPSESTVARLPLPDEIITIFAEG